MKKILFAVSEAAPLIKNGGLGDVGGALPKALKGLGVDVRIILPKYSMIKDEYINNSKLVSSFEVSVGWRNQYCGIEKIVHEGVIIYLVDNEYYFNRDNLYGYYDDGERFTYFCKSVIDSIKHINFIPDVIHCNDWHTALVSVYLKEIYRDVEEYKNIKTVMTIHNLKYQGIFGNEIIADVLGLHNEFAYNNAFEFNGGVNLLKASLYYSDVITTVSKTYAEEIRYPFYGEGLEGVLKENDFKVRGIINGIDYSIFNPQEDPYIYENYTRSLKKKKINKDNLQQELGLTVANVPLISVVSRLVEQKGLDLITHIIKELLLEDIQFIILGTGEERYQSFLKNLQQEYPDKVRSVIKFDVELAQKIYAGSDMMLVPSLFEPCGLTQMIALKYGTIPIVRETGGLKDTVVPYNKYTNEGNGFSFKNYNAHELFETIKYACNVFTNDQESWNILIKNAFKSNYSWDESAKEYIEIYETIEKG